MTHSQIPPFCPQLPLWLLFVPNNKYDICLYVLFTFITILIAGSNCKRIG